MTQVIPLLSKMWQSFLIMILQLSKIKLMSHLAQLIRLKRTLILIMLLLKHRTILVIPQIRLMRTVPRLHRVETQPIIKLRIIVIRLIRIMLTQTIPKKTIQQKMKHLMWLMQEQQETIKLPLKMLAILKIMPQVCLILILP